MRESPVPHLFFIGLTVSLPTIGWSQTDQNIPNNANQAMIILIMPNCVAKTTSPDWLNQIPENCTVRIRNDNNWLNPKVLSEQIPPEYYKPSEYEFSEIQYGVYKIVPITRGMELPSWTKLVKTSTEILRSFDPKSPQEKCGKIKNLPNTDPNNPPVVCFPE
jgi:hypothetical protein